MSARDTNNPKNHVLIGGVSVPLGGKPGIRREFTSWATEAPAKSIQVSLFIRALQKFYDTPYTETLSYFQIAGIHGYPGDLAWGNSEDPHHESKTYQKKMYCTHNELTFPTWHRPYMILFEQTLFNLMGEVIEDLKIEDPGVKKEWLKERSTWRLPYWNWALQPVEGVPDLFKHDKVAICTPSGTEPETVTNPLHRYEMRVDGKVTLMGSPALGKYKIDDVKQGETTTLPICWSKCSGTSRWGIKSSEPAELESQGINNYEPIKSAIGSHKYYEPGEVSRHPVSDLVYRLLSNVKDWRSFSSTITADTSPEPVEWTQWISLEFIHNNLHVFNGGAGDFSKGIGHMSNVPVAAFDPIFWMHHCYLDCIFAMWQVLNPDSWFDPAGGQEKLVPFHNDFGGERHVDYFNSDDVRAYSTFGYEYDVLVRQKGQEDEEYVAGITSHINKTYHGTGDVLQHDKGGLFLSGQLGGGDKDYEDYVINVLYDRYGYEDGAPYTIHFFFREAPAEADVRAGDRMIHEFPGHVGSISTFSSPVETVGQGEDNTLHCAKCARQRDEGVLSRASVSLTISLYKDAVNKNIDAIGDLTPSTVETYLKDGLTWVAVSMEGRFIPWNELDKTKVFILQGTSEQPTDNNIFSTYRSYTSMPAATDGKEAGASKQDYKDFETGRLSMRV